MLEMCVAPGNISITDPLQTAHIGKHVKLSQELSGSTHLVEMLKLNKYHSDLLDRVNLCPFVLQSGGGIRTRTFSTHSGNGRLR